MDELPDRAAIDLQSALAQLRREAAEREVSTLDPPQNPKPVLAGDGLLPVTAHFARRNAAGPLLALHPIDRRADADPKMPRRLIARHPAAQNRRDDPLPKIK